MNHFGKWFGKHFGAWFGKIADKSPLSRLRFIPPDERKKKEDEEILAVMMAFLGRFNGQPSTLHQEAPRD